MALTYDSIATTTLSSATSSITFSSISSAYTDLRIVLVGTVTSIVDLIMQYNSDTATNYSYTRLQGNGSSVSTDTTSTNADIRISFGNPSTSIPFMITNDIFSYAGSTYKPALTTFSGDTSGAGTVGRTISTWRSTSAINSVVLTASGSTWKVGTTATLYGILKA
jgi:hypothetical protein